MTPITNSALPASTGTYRSLPTYQPWSSKQLEQLSKSRDRVQISRFLQEKIPVLGYCTQALPKEAIGKGIGLKSTSINPEFKAAATKHYKAWADSRAVDLRKEGTFYELQARWLSAIIGDGEAFVQKVSDNSPLAMEWRLSDKAKRRLQLQTLLRDQLSSIGLTRSEQKDSRWIEGLQYNALDQLITLRVITGDNVNNGVPQTLDLSASNVFHLKENIRFNQYHGIPFIFRSNEDLLDVLDLKAIRKHAAKIRSALLGATTTRDGKAPNAMQAVMAAEKEGTPSVDTGKRFVEIAEGAVMIPLADSETMTFFQGGESIPFKQILEELTNPFVFGLGYPVEWIFGMGSLGGTAFRGVIEKVRRAHENMRALLYPFLQWTWEWVIADAMMPGGVLAAFASVEDWNEIDFVTDPDPSVDLGRNHAADMERLRANAGTMEDYIEARTGGSGEEVRKARIREKIDDVKFAISIATGLTMDKIMIPASIATLLAIDPMQLQAMSGLASTLAPETIAADLEQIDPPKTQP
jgi:uncharacterized protein YjiS (DUF1127 family)